MCDELTLTTCRCGFQLEACQRGERLLSSSPLAWTERKCSDIPAAGEAFPPQFRQDLDASPQIFSSDGTRSASALQLMPPQSKENLQTHLANVYSPVVAENAGCSANTHSPFLS